VQLAKLDQYIDERRRWADYYSRELAGISWLRTPVVPQSHHHAWQSCVCFLDPTMAPMARNDVMDVLLQRGVSTRPGTHAVHMLGCYRERFNLHPDDFPNARDCEQQSVTLPLHNKMNPEDYARVVQTFRELT
jgi:dTDP-4-amino-4,6-dideoxygalactose transaminase